MPQQHYHESWLTPPPKTPGPLKIPSPQPDQSLASLSSLASQAVSTARGIGDMLGKAYLSQRTGEVNDALSDVNRRFAEWQAQYEETNRGRLALNAAQDYAKAWDDLARNAREQFGGKDYEVFADMLDQRLRERGAYAVKSGMQWQQRQGEAWKQSQEQSQLDEFYREVAANPYDAGRIMAERDALKGSLAARNPGLDLRARFNEIDEKTISQMAEALLARGDTDGVRQLLAGFGDPGSLNGQPARELWNAISLTGQRRPTGRQPCKPGQRAPLGEGSRCGKARLYLATMGL